MSSPVLLLVNKDKKSDKNCLRSLERLTTKNVIAIDVMEVSGSSVSGAGDFNGDGFDDIIIGAIFADPNGNESAGESYVIFGSDEFGGGNS